MRRLLAAIAVACLTCLPVSSAYACGLCTAALIWRIFPPLILWGWVGVVWFLILSVLSAVWRRKIQFVPGPILSVVLAVVASVAYAAMLGPLVILPFAASALAGWLALLWEERRTPAKYPARFRVLSNAVSGTAVALIVLTGAGELVSPTSKSPTDALLRWEGTVSERISFTELKKQEPVSADAYREIVGRARFFAVGTAAKRLAVIGDRERDVPTIIDALERAQTRRDQYVASDIGGALREFTGLPISNEAPAAEWRRAWAAEATAAEAKGD